MRTGKIHVGVGGWDYDPWRGTFYPDGLPKAKQLEYAAGKLTATEINATYYKLQSPELFRRWAGMVPDGFRFAIKASRFCTNRKILGEGGEAIGRFCAQGFTELGDKLGPILWQFMATKKFDYDDFAGFFDLLPETLGGLPLKHVIEVRNATFADPKFVGMCRDRGVTICNSENENYPLIPDITGELVYLRLISASDEIPTGYDKKDLDVWAGRFQAYAEGRVPGDFTPVDRTGPPEGPRDVYAFVIHEGKVRAPAAAVEFIKRVDPTFEPA